MAKQRALGKGLGALIPGPSEDNVESRKKEKDNENKTVTVVATHLLEPNPDQPRRDISEENLQSLASSLEEHGIVQPLIVRKLYGKNGTYQIVAGERRWRAAKIANIPEVPVRIFEGSEQDAMEVSLVENIQREDLAPLEVAEGIKRLIEQFSITQEEASRRIGWSRTAVTNKLRLLNLPTEIKSMLNKGYLSEGHARALLGLNEEERQLGLARSCASKMWSVRQLEEKIREFNNRATQAPRRSELLPLPEFIRDMAYKRGISFKITGSPGKRKLTLSGLDEKTINKLLELVKESEEELFPGK